MSGQRRTRSGRLGTTRDNSFLFAFTPRRGEECSSDSDDSDYFPGKLSSDEDHEDTVAEWRNLKVARKRLKKIEKSISSKSSKTSYPPPPSRLPPEILHRIFLNCIQSEGITQILPRLSLVCKAWHHVASDPSLLRHLDLSAWGGGDDVCCRVSLTRQKVNKLVSSRDLSHCRTLSLADQDKLRESDVRKVLTQTPHLTSLNLRHCKLNQDILDKLPELTPHLTVVKLSCLIESNTSCHILQRFLQALGSQLLELCLEGICVSSLVSNNLANNLEFLMRVITQYCPVLEKLTISQEITSDLRYMPKVTVDMRELCTACPRLTQLCLDGYNLGDNSTTTRGTRPRTHSVFQSLRLYSQTSHICTDHQEAALYSMFHNNKLHELNISQTNLLPTKISREASRVLSVRKLHLSNMFWDTGDLPQLSGCLSSWCDSIETLNLSGNRRTWFNEELSSFFSQPENGLSLTHLRAINLSNSIVDSQNVLDILRHCKCLQEINLTACRELPRGYKKIFHAEEFSGLIDYLSSTQLDL